MRLISPLWKLWFALWFAIPFLVMYPLFYFALVTGRADLVFRLKRVWARIISTGSFLFPRIRKVRKGIKVPQPSVIVANHTSYLDIIFVPFYVDHTAVFMGKKELLKAPLFRSFFKHLDIAVDRKRVTDSHRAFVEAGEKIRQGFSVVIYPEGTISNEGRLKAFKNGAFKLAIQQQVPVVPVVNLDNWKYLQNGGFFKSRGRPGCPQILVGEPIATAGMTEDDLPALREKVSTFMKQALQHNDGKHN